MNLKAKLFVLLIYISSVGYSQNFKNAIHIEGLRTQQGLYNLSYERFFFSKKDSTSTDVYSFTTTIGFINNKEYEGAITAFEGRWYTELFLSKKWNEYGSLKLNFGRFTYNDPINVATTRNFGAIEISTGIRRYFFKHAFFDANTGFGFYSNLPLVNNLLYNTKRDKPFNNHLFALQCNLSIGWAF
jgi:hypothetical protein